MATFFHRPDIQYPPLLENDDIATDPFIRASSGIVEFVSFLGTAFKPVKLDINQNVEKIDQVYRKDPAKYSTIKKILDAEKAENPGQIGWATNALLWLKRGLEFLCVFLELLVEDYRSGKRSSTLVSMGNTAYEQSLKKHHGFVERSLFAVIIRATPYRKDFVRTIAFGRPDIEDKVIDDLAQYLKNMKANVCQIMQLYHQMGYENYSTFTPA